MRYQFINFHKFNKDYLLGISVNLEGINRSVSVSISQENIKETLKNFIPKVMENSVNFFKNITHNRTGLAINIDNKQICQLLNRHDYMDLRQLKAYCPDGLKTTYLKYLNSLAVATDLTIESLKFIDQFNTYMGSLINDQKNFNGSISLYKTSLMKINSNVDEVNKLIKSNFSPNEKQVGVIGDFVKNKSEFVDILNQLEYCTNKLETISIQELHESMKRATEYCIEIRDFIANKELPNVSPSLPKDIGEMTLTAANVLSLYTITTYAVASLRKAIADTFEHISDVYN
jgi:hypothetical protein